MDLELNEDQEFFRETTRKFLAAEAPIPTVRALESDPAGFSPDYWRRGAELGWTSLLVPEADGGGSLSEHGLLDLAMVAEEMGRLVSPGPLAPVNVVATGVATAGSDEQRAAVLPGLISGEAIAAWTGPTGVDGAVDGDALRLTGAAGLVEAGAQASHLLVAARMADGGFTHVLLAVDTPGLTVTPLAGLDLVRRFAEVRFDDVVAPADSVVGSIGTAAAEVDRLGQIAGVLVCAEAAGVADRCFEMTLEYLGDRYSFGRPLSSYQALKHRMADHRVALEACHATVSAAARAVAEGAPDAATLVSVAKLWVGPRVTDLVQDCIQLHGGIAITWEHDLHLYLRRATVDRFTHGTPEQHAERLATELLGVAS